MHILCFVLLGLTITGVLYGTTNVWPTVEVSQNTIELIKRVRFAPADPVEKQDPAKRQNIADDVISSPPD